MKVNAIDKRISMWISILLLLIYFYSLFVCLNTSDLSVLAVIVESAVLLPVLIVVNAKINCKIGDDQIEFSVLLKKFVVCKSDFIDYELLDKQKVSPDGYRQLYYKDYRVVIGKTESSQVIAIRGVNINLIVDFNNDLISILGKWKNN